MEPQKKKSVNLEPLMVLFNRDFEMSDVIRMLDIVLWEFVIDRLKSGEDWTMMADDLYCLRALKEALETCIQSPEQ